MTMPWRIVCPDCSGPVRVRLWEKEGRCRACRPKPKHSQRRTHNGNGYARLLAEHGASE